MINKELMADFLKACTSTKHPLYQDYKEELRKSFSSTGDFAAEQAVEWYLKAIFVETETYADGEGTNY